MQSFHHNHTYPTSKCNPLPSFTPEIDACTYEDPNNPDAVKCENEGDCVDDPTQVFTYTCHCRAGYTGQRCETGKKYLKKHYKIYKNKIYTNLLMLQLMDKNIDKIHLHLGNVNF